MDAPRRAAIVSVTGPSLYEREPRAGVVGVAGTILGALASVGTYLAMSFVAPILTGLKPPFHIAYAAPLIYGVIATTVVLAGAALPAWRTSRLDVVAALQYE